ncbi:recombinase family protein [Streptomyces sp. NPDC001902]
MTAATRPIALIHDRLTRPGPSLLIERLSDCERYAADVGWEYKGIWIEHGPHAYSATDRPQLDALVHLVRVFSSARPVICLVSSWDRLGDEASRGQLHLRVREAGGWCATVGGASDRDEGVAGHAVRHPIGAAECHRLRATAPVPPRLLEEI